MSQVRLANHRPIKLRRLVEFTNSSSLGIVIPKSFVQKLNLRSGEYMACELSEEGSSISLNKCSITGSPEQIEDNND